MSTQKPHIILGLMAVGPEDAPGTRITSLDEFNKCLDLFQSQGFTQIDTARVYCGGQQEAFTREAQWKERQLQVATKWYPMGVGSHKPEVVKAKLADSLRELGTDSIDLFYLHAADRSTPFAETFEALDELYREGKFRRLGLSNFSAFEVAEVVTMCHARGWVRPTVYQGLYNAISRSLETELIPCCRRYGIDVYIFNPLAGGFLSGKYKAGATPAEGRFSDKLSSQGKMYRDRYFKSSLFDKLDDLKHIADKHGLTMVEIALRWCVHHSALNVNVGGGDGIITGFSSLAQLETNLTDLQKGPLPAEVVGALDSAWGQSQADSNSFWHGKLQYGYDTTKVLFGA